MLMKSMYPPVCARALAGELHGSALRALVDDLGQPEVRDLHVVVLVEQVVFCEENSKISNDRDIMNRKTGH